MMSWKRYKVKRSGYVNISSIIAKGNPNVATIGDVIICQQKQQSYVFFSISPIYTQAYKTNITMGIGNGIL